VDGEVEREVVVVGGGMGLDNGAGVGTETAKELGRNVDIAGVRGGVERGRG